jgi:hypothetical protein
VAKELAEWMPSPPGRPGKYVLYISRHMDDDTQVMVMVFAQAYAARKFLDILLRDDGIVWEDTWYNGEWPEGTTMKRGCTIRSETGIIVSTRWYPKRMHEVVEHEYSLQEMAWDLPMPYSGFAKAFRRGPDLPRTLEDDGVGSRARERKERKSSAPRADAPAGYVHVSDLALSMGIDAKQARVALRKVFADGKPAYGWYFDPKTLDDVKAKIKQALK